MSLGFGFARRTQRPGLRLLHPRTLFCGSSPLERDTTLGRRSGVDDACAVLVGGGELVETLGVQLRRLGLSVLAIWSGGSALGGARTLVLGLLTTLHCL